MRTLFSLPKSHLLFGLGLVIITVITYAASLGNGFVGWDDGLLITENAWVHGLSWANVKHVFTSYDPELYVPLSLLSYQLNYAFGELSPFGYHLFNLLLHILNALLVSVLALGLSRRPWAAAFCGVLFALHPLHTEAVAWASARKDVLAAFFALASMVSYLRYLDGRKASWLAASAMLFVLGLMSKASILLLPLVLLLIAWYRAGTPTKRDALRIALHFVLAAVFGIVALGGKTETSGFLWEKILMGGKAVWQTIGKILWPSDFSAFYPYTDTLSLTNPDLFVPLLFILGVTAAAVWALRVSKTPLFAWAFFLLFLIPSFANAARGHNELLDLYITSDRYGYLPSIAVFYVLGIGFAGIRDRNTKAALLGTIALALAMLTYRQSLTWKDSQTFFTHIVSVQPKSYVAYTNLGTIQVQEGNIDDGLALYRKALAIRDDAVTHYNVGQILEYKKRPDEALVSYQKAVASSPLHKEAWVRIGVIFGQRGDTDAARKAFQEALALDPEDGDVRMTLEEMGQP
jgi:protein O-mannosyl-transferase